MSVSRRRFLKAAAVVSTGIVLKPGSFVLGQNSLWSNNSSDPDRCYRREMFEPYIGDIFRVRVGKRIVDLKLVALENISPASRGITTGKVARTDGFSMRFQAATPVASEARAHKLNHSKLGSFDLFISQSKEGNKFVQTAIVNHLV